MTEVITTERLVLRRPQLRDAAAVVEVINDREVSRWLTRAPNPYGRKDAVSFIHRNRKRGGNAFLIFFESKLAGCVGTERELGYWLGRNFWGRGIASEAATAVIGRYFRGRHARLTSGYFIGNSASRHVLRKLGFSTGNLEHARSRATGKFHPLRRMYLARKDWEGE